MSLRDDCMSRPLSTRASWAWVGGRSPGFRATFPRLPGPPQADPVARAPSALARWRPRSQWRVRAGISPASLDHRPRTAGSLHRSAASQEIQTRRAGGVDVGGPAPRDRRPSIPLRVIASTRLAAVVLGALMAAALAATAPARAETTPARDDGQRLGSEPDGRDALRFGRECFPAAELLVRMGHRRPTSKQAFRAGSRAPKDRSVQATAEASGLQMGTTYTWRLAASDGAGAAQGLTGAFTTLGYPLGEAPVGDRNSSPQARRWGRCRCNPQAAHGRFEGGLYVAYCASSGAARRPERPACADRDGRPHRVARRGVPEDGQGRLRADAHARRARGRPQLPAGRLRRRHDPGRERRRCDLGGLPARRASTRPSATGCTAAPAATGSTRATATTRSGPARATITSRWSTAGAPSTATGRA